MMLDLVSLGEIKPLKEDIRCRTCLIFNTILHASDVWEIVEDKFVRITLPAVDSCLLIDKICAGATIREEDYEKIVSCDGYEYCDAWEGINKIFITLIQGIINYLSLTDNKEYSKEIIFDVAKTLDHTCVANVDESVEKENKDIRNQFVIELRNYDIMESVRSALNDT